MKKSLAVKQVEPPSDLMDSETELGTDLREVGFDVLTSEDRVVESRWFHSQKGVDLFVWSDESKNIIKQQFIWSRQVVEWNIIEGLQTGKLVNDSILRKKIQELNRSPDEEANIQGGRGQIDDFTAKMVGHEDINYDEEPLTSQKDSVLSILDSAHNINEKMRTDLIFNIREARCLSDLSHEELLEKYGNPDNPSSLWGKVKAKFFGNSED